MYLMEFLLPRGLPKCLSSTRHLSCASLSRIQCLKKPPRSTPAQLSCRHKSATATSETQSPAIVEEEAQQINRLGAYYEDILRYSLPTSRSEAAGSPSSDGRNPDEGTSPAASDQDQIISRARIVFGSRLLPPVQRRTAIEATSTLIAGVLVPRRPAEPDNCCMSGCVNCVWDNYRDEIEEWAAKSREAKINLRTQSANLAQSMDDDGGGSETNWDLNTLGDGDIEEDLFEGVPVGIREFMRVEKRLKNQHAREGTTG